jgi:cell division protein FtsA
MQLNEPYLIIDLNDNKLIFFVVSFNEKKDFKVLKKIILPTTGILNGRVIDVKVVSQLLKKTINTIEDDANFFFSNATVVINPDQINCLNVSGYKKLNGSKVSSDDIAYILNDIKKIILDSENNYSLVHLFNSNFSLDSDNLENLPIGLFGEFYNQNMSFFLVKKNILKNIKTVFNNCGLKIEKIILRSFAEGIYLLSNNQSDKNFTIFKLAENKISISLFKNKSYVFTEEFNFGFNLVIKDISKLCSLKIEEVENFMKEIELKNILENDNESYLEKKYFYISPYRKIKHKFILDIITARIDELFEICYKKNSNIENLKNDDKIYVFVDPSEYYKNIQHIIESRKIAALECIFDNNTEKSYLAPVNGACELIGKGWEKEAIPINHKKKSLISSFFSRMFN